MDSAIAGLIGGVIGAAAGLVGSLSTSWLALKKEREQALRNKEIEQEKWLRERLQETYVNCIDYLSRISKASEIYLAESGELSAILSKEHQRELFLDYSEAQKWLGAPRKITNSQKFYGYKKAAQEAAGRNKVISTPI